MTAPANNPRDRMIDAFRQSTTFPIVYQPDTKGQMKWWLGGHEIDFDKLAKAVPSAPERYVISDANGFVRWGWRAGQ